MFSQTLISAGCFLLLLNGKAMAAYTSPSYTVADFPGGSGFWVPNDLGFVNSNKIIVADVGDNNHRFNVITGGVNSVFAGNAAGTYTNAAAGTTGPATSAVFGMPGSIWADTNGVVFLADRNGNRVRQVSVGGQISNFAGDGTTASPNGDGGPATSARLSSTYNQINGDTNGNLFIGEYSRIRKVAKTGVISTVVGGGATAFLATAAGADATAVNIFTPRSLFVGPLGDIFFSDPNGRTLVRVTSGGNQIQFMAGAISPPGGVVSGGTSATPTGVPAMSAAISIVSLWVNNQNDVYFTESNVKFSVLTAESNYQTVYQAYNQNTYFAGVAIDDATGKLYVVQTYPNKKVQVFTDPAYVFKATVTGTPTRAPTSAAPTVAPSATPKPSTIPTTAFPTFSPTSIPTIAPSSVPTVLPTVKPTSMPSSASAMHGVG